MIVDKILIHSTIIMSYKYVQSLSPHSLRHWSANSTNTGIFIAALRAFWGDFDWSISFSKS